MNVRDYWSTDCLSLLCFSSRPFWSNILAIRIVHLLRVLRILI